MISKNLEFSLNKALSIARSFNNEHAELEHLLLALVTDTDVNYTLLKCNIKPEDIINTNDILHKYSIKTADYNKIIKDSCKKQKSVTCEVHISPKFQNIVHKAIIHAHNQKIMEINGVNVFVEIISENAQYLNQSLLQKLGIHTGDLIHNISSIVYPDNDISTHDNQTSLSDAKSHEYHIASKSKKSNDVLQNYCRNLNEEARNNKIDYTVGREHELSRTLEVLLRRRKNNPLYIGESGVGKTTIVEGLVLSIIRGKVPDVLKYSMVYSLDLGLLLAGTRYRGDFEERIKSVIQAIESIPYAILFIDEIHTIIGVGSTNGNFLDAGNLLKPALARGTLHCIGATTYKEYSNSLGKDKALARRFQKIDVKEPSVSETVAILSGIKHYYEKYHDIYYTKQAIKSAAELSHKYISGRVLPDKAIDIIDEAGAYCRLHNKTKKVVNRRDIENITTKMINIPSYSELDDTKRVQSLKNNLTSVIFGQEHAIDHLVNSIKVAKSGLRNHEKPMASYLFAGPTGVGKTELAKQLAKNMGINLIRFDMSEYMEPHSISRIIGSPPGYIGYDQGGLLTEMVHNNPYSVVLLDEIEKAHNEIYNILLQIMDYGCITDTYGCKVNFTNVILIMTSNAGAFDRNKNVGFGSNAFDTSDSKKAIEKVFSPEFRNRIDECIQFVDLSEDVILHVANKFILELENQLLSKGITCIIEDEVPHYLVRTNHNREMGARPMEKIINTEIRSYLAELLLNRTLVKGDTVTIYIDSKTGRIAFKVKKFSKR